MAYAIEKNDLDRGVLLIKHLKDADRSFENLPIRKLRASGIGRDCDTELFLSAAGRESQFDKKTLRIFEIGRVMEPVIVKWMQEDGWEVQHNADDEHGMIMVVGPGIVTGHYDIIARHPKITKNEWTLLDIKTMNTRRFNTWNKNGVQASDPAYYAQLLFYGYAWGYKKLGLVGMEKPTGDYEVEMFDFNRKHFEELKARAADILDADKATSLQDKKCNWCSKKDSCGGVMTNPLPKIKDKKYLPDLLASYDDTFIYTEMGNLIKLSPRYKPEEMLIPPDGVIFKREEEPEMDDEWIEL